MRYAVPAALLASGLAAAETFSVTVGDGGLVFQPNVITAADGDMVEFEFVGGSHDVSMSDFDNPCNPAAEGGFYSGTITGPSDTKFTVEVNGTDPIWFYCSVGPHCSSGMYGVINPASQEAVDTYGQVASQAGAGVAPGDEPFGGILSEGEGDDEEGGEDTGDEQEGGDDEDEPDSAVRVGGAMMSIVGAVAVAMFMI